MTTKRAITTISVLGLVQRRRSPRRLADDRCGDTPWMIAATGLVL